MNVFGWLLSLALSAGAVHDGPPVYLEFDLFQDRLHLEVVGERAVLHPWLDLPPELDPATEDGQSRLSESIRLCFETRYEVLVEHERLTLTVQSAGPGPDVAFGGEPSTRLVLSAPLDRLPRRVDLSWRATFGDEWPDDPMPVQFDCYNRIEWHTIDEVDQGCTWIARRQERKRAGFPDLPEPEPPVPPEPISVPVLSLGLGLAGLVLVFWRRGSVLARGGGIAALVLAVPLRGTATWDVARAPSLPDRAEALVQFESRHRNIYAALSAETEDEVYARLARSFDPTILERQYLDLLHSMQLRMQGGAVCSVTSIDVLERAVDFEAAPPDGLEVEEGTLAYWVEWRWRVIGEVVHWAHRHRRMNQYHARYWLRHDGVSWKIAAYDEKDAFRVDDDEAEWGQWDEEGAE